MEYDETVEGCIAYLRRALVGDDAGQYAISVVDKSGTEQPRML